MLTLSICRSVIKGMGSRKTLKGSIIWALYGSGNMVQSDVTLPNP